MSPRPGPVRGRHTFEALSRSSRRAARGPVRVHFLATGEHDKNVLVAYSISRQVGGAVERNRWRRRLRAIVAETSAKVMPGAYLIGLAPGVNGLTYNELRDRVIDTMARASGADR